MKDTFESAGLKFEASLRCLWDDMDSIDRCIPADYLCIPMFIVFEPTSLPKVPRDTGYRYHNNLCPERGTSVPHQLSLYRHNISLLTVSWHLKGNTRGKHVSKFDLTQRRRASNKTSSGLSRYFRPPSLTDSWHSSLHVQACIKITQYRVFVKQLLLVVDSKTIECSPSTERAIRSIFGPVCVARRVVISRRAMSCLIGTIRPVSVSGLNAVFCYLVSYLVVLSDVVCKSHGLDEGDLYLFYPNYKDPKTGL
jgi:hypothetical protein